MKFAEHLGAHITPEWRKQYILYEVIQLQVDTTLLVNHFTAMFAALSLENDQERVKFKILKPLILKKLRPQKTMFAGMCYTF